MNNLTLIANSAMGGNIVTILARQAIRIKGMFAAAAFQARVAGLQRAGEEYVADPVFIAGIPVSVKKQEAYTYRADVTQHAMESGAILTDHVILQPVRVDVSFEITNWELDKPYQAHDLMVKLFEERLPLDLLTAHSILKDMILTSYQANNEVPNWGALDCRCSFVQVKYINLEGVITSEETVTPTENTGGPDNSKSAMPERKRGRQTPKEYIDAKNEEAARVAIAAKPRH